MTAALLDELNLDVLALRDPRDPETAEALLAGGTAAASAMLLALIDDASQGRVHQVRRRALDLAERLARFSDSLAPADAADVPVDPDATAQRLQGYLTTAIFTTDLTTATQGGEQR